MTQMTNSSTPFRCGQSPDGDNAQYLTLPQIFDLITFADQQVRTGSSAVPSKLLRPHAIDASIRADEGSNTERTWEIWLGGLQMVTEIEPGSHSRSSVIVFKTAKVEFIQYDERLPSDRATLDSGMTEIFDIVHQALLEQSNIVNMLGLGWDNSLHQPQYFPTIVLEHANCGSLDSLQSSADLSSQQRLRLCIDVGAGPDILHECGLAHGDVKAENVMVFLRPDNSYMAKIANFGFSDLNDDATSLVKLNGTRLWEAPEATHPVVKNQIHLTDIYSYGLLVWRLAADGTNPFSIVLRSSLSSEELCREADRLKQSDELVSTVCFHNWYPLFLQQRWRDIRLSLRLAAASCTYKDVLVPLDANAPETKCAISSLTSMLDPAEQESDLVQLSELLARDLGNDRFYGSLDAVFANCLGKDPTSRSLPKAIEAVRGFSPVGTG